MKKEQFRKWEKSLIYKYEHARGKSLTEVYKRPSEAKKRIEEEIKIYMLDCNGYDFRITSASPNFFSCGYRVNIGGITYLVYYKPSDWEINIPLQYIDTNTGEVKNRY